MNLGKQNSLIVGIGGGSIAFIIANRNKTSWLKSFEIGGQRLVEYFHHNDPISDEEIDSLKRYFDLELVEKCGQYNPITLIECLGIFDTLSKIYCREYGVFQPENATEYLLLIKGLDSINKSPVAKQRGERLKILGMIEMHVDMIVVASILVEYLIQILTITNLRVSGYVLKEGILMDAIESVQNSIADN